VNSGNFFFELKRRNVYKLAVLAGLFIQAASIFLPAFDAPAFALIIL
jgi:hypothetical protein